MSSSESWKQASSKPMRAASSRKISHVGPGLAGRRQDGPRQLQIVMPVGEVEVGVLEKSGGGQQDVGVIGGIGLDLFEHHGEQILAAQSFEHGVLIGRDRRRIRVVDDQRLDRRARPAR